MPKSKPQSPPNGRIAVDPGPSAVRIVLDTNVLVSGLAYPGSVPGRIVAAWRSGVLEVVLSPYLLAELSRVLPRLNHRLQMTDGELADLVDSLAVLADVWPHAQLVESVVRDVADDPVLALLLTVEARAQWLVTGDRDLLILAPRFAVLSPAEFCARFGI